MKMKQFPLRDVLTLTTGLLLTKPNKDDNGISALYELLEYMTGEASYTHTLGRFAEECKPLLLASFPELDSPELQFKVAELQEMLKIVEDKYKDNLITGWLSGLIAGGIFKEEYLIGKRGVPWHEAKNPITEMENMIQAI